MAWQVPKNIYTEYFLKGDEGAYLHYHSSSIKCKDTHEPLVQLSFIEHVGGRVISPYIRIFADRDLVRKDFELEFRKQHAAEEEQQLKREDERAAKSAAASSSSPHTLLVNKEKIRT